MIVLDASVIIAHFASGDPFAPQALEIMDTEEELCLHPMTLAECLVGAERLGQATVMRERLGAIGIGIWHPDDDDPYRIAELRAHTSLKLPDCCVISAAIAQTATLASFDEKLLLAAERLGVQTSH